MLDLSYLEVHSFAFHLTGPHALNDSEIIAKYEIMDGLPVRGKL
jgi:hypothetical protein